MSYDFSGKIVYFSGTNPFDRSYHSLQRTYDLRIADLLCKIMNASMEVIKSPLVTDLVTYERNPNAWVVEQLTTGSAELSSTSLVLTPDSENLVDYSLAIGTFRPQIYYKAQSVRMANNIYFIPFSVDTWIALLCILLSITVVQTFILARETRLPHSTPYDIIARIADEKHDKGIDWNKIDVQSTPKENILQREHWEISEILLVTCGALGQQGSERDPSTAAARTLLLALFVFAVLIYTAYSASVISLISLLPNTDVEVHTGWAAARNSQIILQDTNFFKYNFEAARDSVQYSSLEEGLEEALKGRAVFVADRDVSLTTLHRLGFGPDLRCSLARAFPGLEYQRVFALREKSPYQIPINFNILRLRQYGLLSREWKKVFNRQPPCRSKERIALSGFVSVDLSDTFPALMLLMWGCVLACCVLFAEYLIFYSSLEMKNTFGESWKKFEAHTGKVLERWIWSQIYEKFRNSSGLVAAESTQKEPKPLPPFIN